MTQAGADVIIAHVGLTTWGTIGARTARALTSCVELIQTMRDAAVAIDAGVIVLCHGGPIAEPDDAAHVLGHTTGVSGFFGASSMERLPTEVAMTQTMRRFKALSGGSLTTPRAGSGPGLRGRLTRIIDYLGSGAGAGISSRRPPPRARRMVVIRSMAFAAAPESYYELFPNPDGTMTAVPAFDEVERLQSPGRARWSRSASTSWP